MSRQPSPVSSDPSPAMAANAVPSDPNSTEESNQSSGKSPSRWMERSSIKMHFKFLFVGNRKIAKCVYCGKMFNEGESTGNLSKHVTSVHSSSLESRKTKACKIMTLEMLTRRSKSLRLTDSLIQECERNPAHLETLLLITEGFLPLNFVRLLSWSSVNRKYAANALIRCRGTLSRKITLYKCYLNESLRYNLGDSSLVNIQLDLWTSPSNITFLAVMVSFAPNILNTESLELANDSRILLNNRGESRNCHLLEFVSLGDKRYTDTNTCNIFMNILQRHNLVDKLGTITMGSASNTINFHKGLIYEYFNNLRPAGHQMMGKVRFIRCGSNVLKLIFERIIEALGENLLFEDAFNKITRLAKVMRHSTAVKRSLKKHGLPLIPYETSNSWICTWRQVNEFIQNFPAYSKWFETLEPDTHSHIINRVQSLIAFDGRTIQLLSYFIECCNILGDLNSAFQDDEFNNLPQGVPLYYLLGHYYKLCLSAYTGTSIPRTKGMDFSYFNGPDTLNLDEKRLVLQAIKDSYPFYQDYLSHLQANPLFYVAVILDPTAKQDKLYKSMETDEFTVRLSEINSFMKNYLTTENLSCTTDEQQSKTSNPRPRNSLLSFNIHDAPCPLQHTKSGATEADHNNANLEEWERYQREPAISGNRNEAIKWWYNHRDTYPSLFKLAISLFYTKITSCDVKRCFSIARKVVKRDRARLSHKSIGTMMILRDRFSNFGFYHGDTTSSNAILDEDYGENEDEDTDLDLNDADNVTKLHGDLGDEHKYNEGSETEEYQYTEAPNTVGHTLDLDQETAESSCYTSDLEDSS